MTFCLFITATLFHRVHLGSLQMWVVVGPPIVPFAHAADSLCFVLSNLRIRINHHARRRCIGGQPLRYRGCKRFVCSRPSMPLGPKVDTQQRRDVDQALDQLPRDWVNLVVLKGAFQALPYFIRQAALAGAKPISNRGINAHANMYQ
jgi:hypothetical protein